MTGNEAIETFIYGKPIVWQVKRDLTRGQRRVYDLAKAGLSVQEISQRIKKTEGTVYDTIVKIRANGWRI